MIYLASLGDEAKIWDVPSFSLLEEFNPHSGCISDVTWSHDGYLIASCCSTDKNVHVRLTKTAQSVPSEPITLPSGCQCLDYSSTSRYLLCGCVDGSMHIWDRKLHAMKKSYTNLKHSITVARWNWNDTNICVGLDNGKILLYNTATHQTSNPLVAPSVNISNPNSQAIRQLRYNPYHKSSLVAVSEDGAVNFWDTNTRRLVHAFTKTHQAPARDVVFSPINDYLMVSVGLDKRAVFYDIQNKTPVKTVVAEQPLTSVEMMPDGATIVVGTSRGKVFFYDMRQSSTPIFNFTAHKSSVKHLSFVKKDGEMGDSSQSLRRQLPTTPMLPTDAHNQNSNSSTNYQSPRLSTYQSGLEIFSPASNANKSSNSFTEVTSSEKSWMHSNLSKLQTTDIFATGDGVYSPVRQENSLSINNTHNRSSILSNNSFLTQILGPAETTNNDPASSQINSLYTIGESPGIVDERNSLSRENTEHSPRPQRGMGASPSLQQLSAPRLEDVDSSLLPNRTSPSSETPTRSSAASAITSSPAQSRVSPEDRPEVLGAASANGGASSQSPPRHYRAEPGDLSNLLAVKNGTASPSRSPNSLQQRTRTPSEPVAGSSLSATSSASSVRHMVQDLLKEHFQEHQDQLKTEIRAMLGEPGFNTLGAAQTSHSSSLPSQGNPGIFHAEFIRNLIREELEDVKDFIHKEFWCVQVELIKQVFQLQKRIESGLSECAINPLLLDEIDRLREENARLKKTF